MPLPIQIKTNGPDGIVLELHLPAPFPALVPFLERREVARNRNLQPAAPTPESARDAALLLRSLPPELTGPVAQLLGGQLCWEAACL